MKAFLDIQIRDSIELLKLIENGSSTEAQRSFKAFASTYSLIAAERIINYYYDNCINVFIARLSGNPCLIKDADDVFNNFASNFKGAAFNPACENACKRLATRISWNLSEANSQAKLLLNSQISSPIFHTNQHCTSIFKDILRNQLLNLFAEQFNSAMNSKNLNRILLKTFKTVLFEEFFENFSLFGTKPEFESIVIESYIDCISKHSYNIIIACCDVVLLEFSSLVRAGDEKTMTAIHESISSGLLNIGKSTSEILLELNQMIPYIRQMDPSGFVLDNCLRGAKTYLKRRLDLNSCLLHFLLSSLDREFSIVNIEGTNHTALSYEMQADLSNWKLEPAFVKEHISSAILEADPVGLIISSLKDSCGNLFESYQKQLGERLLKANSLDEVERVVDEVEKIKLRCGDNLSPAIDVMLHDIIDSRAKNIRSDSILVTIISHRYWPEPQTQVSFEHPESLKANLEQIEQVFSVHQRNKNISWRPHYDEVDVELEFENGTFSFKCPPEAAVLVNSFNFPEDAQESFDFAMVKILTSLKDKKQLQRAVQYWLRKRVIQLLDGHQFKFVSYYEPKYSDCVDAHLAVLEDAEAEEFADEEEELDNEALAIQKYWPIISNMFKTFGQLSAERIHSTLSMYSREYKGPHLVLLKFLQHRVREGILQTSGNKIVVYSIKK